MRPGVTITNAPQDVRATKRAVLLMFASAVLFGAMAFAAKLSSAGLSGAQVAMIRFMTGLVPILLIPRVFRKAITFQRLDLMIMRGLFGGTAVLLYFLAIEHINVGVATLLNYTSPVFAGLFSLLFLNERISPRVLVPMPVAFAGVFVVVHSYAKPGDVFGFGAWELAALCSAFLSGAAVTTMRAARRSENSWAIYASFCLLGSIVTAPMGILRWQTPHGDAWFALAATSIFSIGAQLLLTFSLRWVDAMTVGVISQIAVVVSMVLGVTLLHESLPPLAILGSALTIAGVVGVVYVTSLAKRTVSAEEMAPEA